MWPLTRAGAPRLGLPGGGGATRAQGRANPFELRTISCARPNIVPRGSAQSGAVPETCQGSAVVSSVSKRWQHNSGLQQHSACPPSPLLPLHLSRRSSWPAAAAGIRRHNPVTTAATAQRLMPGGAIQDPGTPNAPPKPLAEPPASSNGSVGDPKEEAYVPVAGSSSSSSSARTTPGASGPEVDAARQSGGAMPSQSTGTASRTGDAAEAGSSSSTSSSKNGLRQAAKSGYNANQNSTYWSTRPVPVTARALQITTAFSKWFLRTKLRKGNDKYAAATMREVRPWLAMQCVGSGSGARPCRISSRCSFSTLQCIYF